MTSIYKYIFWVLAHLSLFINALAGGRPYESVCARAWRTYEYYGGSHLHWGTLDSDGTLRLYYMFGRIAKFWAWSTIHLTELFERDHCKKAYRCHQAVMHGLRRSKVYTRSY